MTAPLILAALLLIPATRPYIDVPEPQHHAVARKVEKGRATWYDAPTIRDAAAGPDLRRMLGRDWRGSVVRVSSGERSIRVRLTDWCLCGKGRVIDLDDRAFARLAPLGRGVITVSVEEDPR